MSKIPKKGNKESRLIILSKKTHELEQKIIKNEELSLQKYRALQDFVRLLTNFASHDIKNAIHNLDGLIANVKVNSITSEEIIALNSCVENIRNSLDEFKLLSSDIDKNEFKLVELMTSLSSLHRPLFKKHNIKFIIDYNVDKNTVIRQTFHHILQILNNMIINSFEFLENKNENEIKIIINSIDENSLEILILDTGKGIDSKIKSRIFDPYFTTKEKGSGVGLAHVKHTLSKIGGVITLEESNFCNFSTIFKINLPIK
ncbi:HAMP domain-containing sensor histidine kinase [uncultured Flavobacterium sp.]|uniref:sensor histidine kinase n=1 Tax=uncultured Flavobacterium sp. TaxID=165435 RepID=UPI00261F9BBB|nr:HAMP domain-containing sensor histidine kinase [uncultured Flavobacterium sp.]